MTGLAHGTSGLLLAYLLTLIGLAAGLRRAHAPRRRYLQLPLIAVPTMLIAAIAWSLIAAALPRHTPPALVASLGAVFLLIVAALTGLVLPRLRGRGPQHLRGALLAPRAQRRPAPNASTLTLAGVPIPALDETKHFKLLGTTGTGKSTAIRELLAGALARGDRALIADADGGYLKAFHNPARGDRILNPFEPRAARWDLFGEIVEPHDAEQLARALIPDYDGPDRNWRRYGRTFLAALLRQLHRGRVTDLAQLYRLLTIAPLAELRDLLAATPAAPFFSAENPKFFESVRSITTVHLEALEHLARQQASESLSLRRWTREGQGVLFLPYRAGQIASLHQVLSAWLRLAIFETLNAEEGDQRLWFVIDEFDALGAIDGLKDALARLRKFGGRCILGLQSIAQARGLYGDTEAQTIIENCGNTLILRCSASERGGTAEFASHLIGRREILRHEVSRSRPSRLGGGLHETRTTADRHVIEEAVLPAEIEQLPDGEGLLKLASEPAWRRVIVPLPTAPAPPSQSPPRAAPAAVVAAPVTASPIAPAEATARATAPAEAAAAIGTAATASATGPPP